MSDQRESIRLFDLFLSQILRYQSLMIEFDRLSEPMFDLNPPIESILALK